MSLREVKGYDGCEYFGDFLTISCRVKQRLIVEDGGIGSLDIFGGVKQLLKTGHTQCDVLIGYTSQMESVERHLGGRLTDRLCSHRTDSLTSRRKGLIELRLDFFQQAQETLLSNFVILADCLTGEEHADMDPKQFQPVLLLKFSLLLDELVLLAFFLHSSVLLQDLLVVQGCLG